MCIFCKIIKGEIPSYKIYEDEFTYAFLDIADDVADDVAEDASNAEVLLNNEISGDFDTS